MISTQNRFLTTERAAQVLEVSVRTLEGWRVRGYGPKYRKIGRLVRYTYEDIEEFIDSTLRVSTSAARGHQ